MGLVEMSLEVWVVLYDPDPVIYDIFPDGTSGTPLTVVETDVDTTGETLLFSSRSLLCITKNISGTS